MDETRHLIGSESHDRFKFWHKSGPSNAYALDGDFLLVEKPYGIIAVLDYKNGPDPLTFAEVLAYNHLLELGIPVYLVKAESPEFSNFVIERYCGGDWKPNPPTWKVEVVLNGGSAQDYWAWEKKLRDDFWKKRMETYKGDH